ESTSPKSWTTTNGIRRPRRPSKFHHPAAVMASARTAGVSCEYVRVASWRRSSRSPASVSSATPSGYTQAVGFVELAVVHAIVASPQPAERGAVTEMQHQRDQRRPGVSPSQTELQPPVPHGDERHLHD